MSEEREAARRLVNDPLYTKLKHAVLQETFQGWVETTDMVVREAIWNRMRGMQDLDNMIQRMAGKWTTP
jgi:hypothetical protein